MTFQALGFRFVVDAADGRVGALLAELYALCRLDVVAADAGTPIHRFVVDGPLGGRVHLALDDEPLLVDADDALLVPTIAWAVNQRAVASVDDAVLVHAGAVATGGRAVLLVGGSGAGKTTLTARLVADGHDYLTDEAVPFDAAAGIVAPYPKPLKLEVGAAPLFPDAVATALGAAAPAPDGSVQVAPAWLRADVATGAARPVLVLAIDHEAGAPTHDEPLSRAAMLVHLAQQSFNLGTLGARGFANLATLAARCACHRLRPGPLDVASARVSALLAQEPTPAPDHRVETIASDASRGDRPRPRGGLVVARLDGEVAILDDAARRAHHLNRSASAVWEACDGTGDAAAIAARLADRFGADPAVVRHDVDEVLGDLAAAGVLVGTD
ncbi:MAG TPA: PqqD family peptide modification chaperone [Acidimicrobiia bacterium]|nr:PqqD family peptide modification chaperone [Acidimicrobiia bacterium]